MRATSSIVIALLVTSSIRGALASDSDLRKQLQRDRAGGPLMGSSVKLASRLNGAGREATLAALLQSLRGGIDAVQTGGAAETSTLDGQSVMARGRDWVLEVRGDGDWARYRRMGAPPAGAGSADRPTLAELEGPARNFIAKALGGFVKLGATEELRSWRTVYEVGGGGDLQGNRSEQVLSSTVIFTRMVGGVPVVGPGSKVAITFASGAVVGFHFDWSALGASSSTVAVVSAEVATSRIAGASAAQRAQAAQLTEHSVECGLYDGGALTADKTAPLQPGCVARYTSTSASHLGAAFEYAVPIGAKVVRDAGWPETTGLAPR